MCMNMFCACQTIKLCLNFKPDDGQKNNKEKKEIEMLINICAALKLYLLFSILVAVYAGTTVL